MTDEENREVSQETKTDIQNRLVSTGRSIYNFLNNNKKINWMFDDKGYLIPAIGISILYVAIVVLHTFTAIPGIGLFIVMIVLTLVLQLVPFKRLANRWKP